MAKFFFILFFLAVEIGCVVGAVLLFDTIVAPILFLALAFILIVLVVVGYNKMVRYRNKIKESLALVDIQLKLRFDLVPNLVNVVKGYAKHEQSVLSEVTKLRNLAISTQDPEQKLEYANKLVPGMKNLIAIAESYPEVKSSALFKSLMEQLVDIEDRLVASRRIYDSNVNLYNSLLESFPMNMLASTFNFKQEKMFKIDAGENIKVNF